MTRHQKPLKHDHKKGKIKPAILSPVREALQRGIKQPGGGLVKPGSLAARRTLIDIMEAYASDKHDPWYVREDFLLLAGQHKKLIEHHIRLCAVDTPSGALVGVLVSDWPAHMCKFRIRADGSIAVFYGLTKLFRAKYARHKPGDTIKFRLNLPGAE